MNFIIVLGNSNPEVRHKRVQRAVTYFFSLKPTIDPDTFFITPTAKLIFSGCSLEGEDMKNIAISKFGVNDTDCIVENKSRNTRENFTESIELLRFLGWFDPTTTHQKHSFIVCTSSFHAKRGLITGLEILLPYGEVGIIHTNEQIPKELEQRENILLANYINDIIVPSHLKK